MAITNQERVGKGMALLRAGLAPFVEREFTSQHHAQAVETARRYVGDDRTVGKKPVAEWDVAALLKLMWDAWHDVFGRTLGRAERWRCCMNTLWGWGRASWAGCGPDVRRGGHPEIDADHGIFGR